MGEIWYAPTDQVIQHLLDPPAAVISADLNVLLVQLERWLPRGAVHGKGFNRNTDDFTAAVRYAAGRTDKAVFMVIFCPTLGGPTAHTEASAIETRLSRALELVPGVDVVTSSALADFYPIEDYSSYFDTYTDERAQIPYTPLGFTALGTLIARRIHALISPDRKVIAVDCDNTLWDGLCADGPMTLHVAPRCELLQHFLIKQSRSGRLICLTSKNDESDVFAVFERHPGMLLRREHLAAWKINWNSKPDNLRVLSDELGLGLGSFLFLDDDPLQCDQMRTLLPEVGAFLMPATYSETARFLRDTWDFDLKALTEEDRNRKLYYQQNSERETSRRVGASLADFLASLELSVEIAALCEQDLRRIVQLTQRTNQFNLNGIKRSAAELRAMIQTGDKQCVTVRASDRFGDYGLIGMIIYFFMGQSLIVDALLLSCRALGRGIEELLLVWLARKAASYGAAQLSFEYRYTGRNSAVRTLLNGLGICLTQIPCLLPVDDCCEQLGARLTPCRLSVDQRIP